MRRPESSGRADAAAFIELLRAAEEPVDARGLKQRRAAQGVPADAVDAAWRRAQPVLRQHPDVVFDPAGAVYHHRESGPSMPGLNPAQALERLLPNRMTGRQSVLADAVRAALAERDELEDRLRAGYHSARELRSAQVRQIRLDAVRALVEVVCEVEELAVAGAEPTVTAERVRALAHVFGLHAIGRAGEQTTFTPALHTPFGTWPSHDSPVVVLRPGYSWHDGVAVVLVAKAQVAVVDATPAVHGGGAHDGNGGG